MKIPAPRATARVLFDNAQRSPILFVLLATFVTPILVALTPGTAQALQQRPVGDVTVERGETVSEASTAAGEVLVEGRVTGDVDSGAGAVDIRGPVDGDVDSAMGDVEVDAPVGGDVEVSFGDVYVNAPVAGDVEVRHGDMELGPEGRVEGDVSLGSGEFSGERAAVAGTLRADMAPDFDGFGGKDSWAPGLVGRFFGTLLFVACAVLLAVLAPRPLAAVARRAEEAPGRSLIIGVASVPAAVILAVVLAISILGIPLLLLAAPAYLALVLFGALVAAYVVGERLLYATGRYRAGNALAAAVGALVLSAVYQIPFLGSLLFWGLALLGAGAAIRAVAARRRPRTYAALGS